MNLSPLQKYVIKTQINGFDQKTFNVRISEMGFSYGPLSKFRKKIQTYTDRNKINKSYIEYMKQYTASEFDEFIKQQYNIKGEVTPLKIMNARKKDDTPLEKEEQQKLCKWLKANKIGHWANGLGIKLDYDVKYMASLRSQGHYKGLPDMTILLGNGKICYIELKRQKGGVVSEEQKKWLEYLNKNGYPAKVCNGCDEAIEFIKSLLESEV